MNGDYSKRLENYIRSEALSQALYTHLSLLCSGEMQHQLRHMAADEARHLKAMQMEYYLLTGDTLPLKSISFENDLGEGLRRAYAGEWDAAEGYAEEAGLQKDEKLKKLFLAQSRDELRHRAAAKLLLGRMTGMGG